MYYNFAKPIYFVVADTDPQNPPKSFEELRNRCNEIKKELPAHGDNTNFTEKVFMLFKDCGLITPENIAFLTDKNSCDQKFKCKMNPLGGVLREDGLPMGNPKRYYCTKSKGRAVRCESVVYYITSQWYAPGMSNPTKPAFYNWFVQQVIDNYPTLTKGNSTELFYHYQN